MSRASNSLRLSDVIATPIKLKYTASYNECTLEEYGITVLTGVNGPVTITGSIPQETLNYRSVRQLYYANVLTGSYLTTTSSFDVSIQSTAASGTFDSDNRYFPTQSGATVRIVSIPRGVFGEKISRHSFSMTSSAYRIVDDGNGNLVDVLNSPVGVNIGNIIYPQGMAIITNSDYLEIFPYPPVANNDTASFVAGFTPKLVNILANDDPGTGTLLNSSVVLFGGDVSLFTNNLNGTVTLNTTNPGTYTTYYTVQSQIPDPCPMTSNSASITIEVTAADCTLAGTLVVPPTTTTTSTTTSTTTVPPTTTTSTTTSTTTATPTTTTSTTTSTTTATPTTTTSTTTSTTTAVPTTTTSTTTSTTTAEPTTTTSTTTSTTTAVPTTTTSTTTSTTTVTPTTTTTTTVAPTTTTTTVPPTTTTTTTIPPTTTTTTSTTTSTTTPPPTTTTTSTTTSTTTVASTSWSVRTEGGSTPINICTNTPITVYSAVGATFTTGTALFSDPNLNFSLIIGGSPNSYISEVLSGIIFEYSDGSGQISTNTGNTC